MSTASEHYRARLTLASFLANAVSLGVILSFSEQQQRYIIHPMQRVSALWFVWVPCLQWTVLHGSSLLPTSLWRSGLPVVAAGSLLCILARIGVSVTTSYAGTLLLEGLLTGTAFSMICTPLKCLMNATTGIASGKGATSLPRYNAVASSGVLVGAVFWSVVKQALPGDDGVEWMHRVIAIVSAALLAVVVAAVWSCPVDSVQSAEVTGSTEDSAPSLARQPMLWRLGALIAIFSIYAGIAVLPLFVAAFAADREMGESASTTVQTLFYVCGAIGHCVCSLAEHQFESKYMLTAIAVISGVLDLAMPVAVAPAIVYVYFALLGLLFGSMLARPPSYFARSLFCNKDEWTATVASCAGFIFGAALCAFVQDSTERGWYAGGFVSAGGLLAGSVAMAILTCVEPRLAKASMY